MNRHHLDDDELARTLGAADALETGPPPVAAIVERGRRDRRRLRLAAVAGAAAAVVAVVGGAALVSTGGEAAIAPADRGDSAPAAPESPEAPEDAGPVPQPPGGMRWVGTDGVMLAVPEAWVPRVLQCDASGCRFPDPDGGAAVELLSEEPREGQPLPRDVCSENPGCVRVEVPGRDAGDAVYIDAGDAEAVATVASTVQVMPPGAVVVPERRIQSLFIGAEGRAGYLRQLRRAGLEADPARDLDPDGTFAVEPAPGSVVPEGSTVRLVRPAA